MTKIMPDRSTPDNRAYWDFVEKVAAEVKTMILSESDVRTVLQARINTEGSQDAAAKWLGVSGAYLCDVMKARRAPGPKLLKRLGIKRKVTYER